MLDVTFAHDLLKWSTRAIFYSFTVLLFGVCLGYLFDQYLSMGWQAVGHFFIASGAFGIKVSYIARLAAMDVLNPHPEGWIAAMRPARTGRVVREARASANAA